MFTSRHVKHSRLLLRHARKYLRYKDDQLNSADRDQIVTGMKDLREALRQRDRERIHSTADALDKTLHRLTPVTWESHWRENCEVTPAPDILRQIGEFIVRGRNYINVVSLEDDQLLEIQPKKMFFFFTFSQLICQRQKYLVYAPPDTLSHDFNVFPGRIFHRGDIIARGAIDTGDQVFVDKFSYNFVKPHRGDVFVFRTNHIPGIREDPEAGSPFYIKRLAGLPGDRLRIDPPFLYVNGKKAEGYGFAREMAAKPPYRGYAPGHDYLSTPQQTYTVPPRGYFAMGDNSYNSYDSRYWGPVPEENLVGRGLLVYWPFYQHWGLIR